MLSSLPLRVPCRNRSRHAIGFARLISSTLSRPEFETSRAEAKSTTETPEVSQGVQRAGSQNDTSNLPPYLLNQPHYYTETLGPTIPDLKRARRFFTAKPGKWLFACHKFSIFPKSSVPEIALLGRSNVGKSSLVNELLQAPKDKQVANVSATPGMTKLMHAYAVGPQASGGLRNLDTKNPFEYGRRWIGPERQQVVVVDMPGYGHNSRKEWGEEIMKYLTGREQLKRAFVLLDAEHGAKQSDLDLLSMLQEQGVPHQIILTKADKGTVRFAEARSKSPKNAHSLVMRQRHALAIHRKSRHGGSSLVRDVLACSTTMWIGGREVPGRLGVDGIRWAILQAAGLEEVETPDVEVEIPDLEAQTEEDEWVDPFETVKLESQKKAVRGKDQKKPFVNPFEIHRPQTQRKIVGGEDQKTAQHDRRVGLPKAVQPQTPAMGIQDIMQAAGMEKVETSEVKTHDLRSRTERARDEDQKTAKEDGWVDPFETRRPQPQRKAARGKDQKTAQQDGWVDPFESYDIQTPKKSGQGKKTGQRRGTRRALRAKRAGK